MAVLKPKYISPSMEIGPKQVDLTQGCEIQFTVDSDEPVTQIDLEFKDSEGRDAKILINEENVENGLPGYETYYIVQDHAPYYTKCGFYNWQYYDIGEDYCETFRNNMFHPLVQNFETNVEEKFYLSGVVFPNKLESLSLTEMFYIHHYTTKAYRSEYYMRYRYRTTQSWSMAKTSGYTYLLNDDFFEFEANKREVSKRPDKIKTIINSKFTDNFEPEFSTYSYFLTNNESDLDVITKTHRHIKFKKNSLISKIHKDLSTSKHYVSFWSQNFYDNLDEIAKKHFGGYIPSGKHQSLFEKIFFKFEGTYLNENSQEKTFTIYFQLGANNNSDAEICGSLDRIKLNYFNIDQSEYDVSLPKNFQGNGGDGILIAQDSIKNFLGFKDKSNINLSLLKLNYQIANSTKLPGLIFDQGDYERYLTGLPVHLSTNAYDEEQIFKNYIIKPKSQNDKNNGELYHNIDVSNDIYFKGALDNVYYLASDTDRFYNGSDENYKEKPLGSEDSNLEIPFVSHYQALFVKEEDSENFISEPQKFKEYIGLDSFGQNIYFNYFVNSTSFADFKQGKIDLSIKLNDIEHALTKESFYYFEDSNIKYNFLINETSPKNKYVEQNLTFEIKQDLKEGISINALQKIKYWKYILYNELTKKVLYESENYYSNNPKFVLNNLLKEIPYLIKIKCYTNLDKELIFSNSFSLENNFLKYYQIPKYEALSDSGIAFDWKNVVNNNFSFHGDENVSMINIGTFKDVYPSELEYTFSSLKSPSIIRTIVQPVSPAGIFLIYRIGGEDIIFQTNFNQNNSSLDICVEAFSQEQQFCEFEIPYVMNNETNYFLDIVGNVDEDNKTINFNISLILNKSAIIPGVNNYTFEDEESDKILSIDWVIEKEKLLSFDLVGENYLNSVNISGNCYLSYAYSAVTQPISTFYTDNSYEPKKITWDNLVENDLNPIYCLDFLTENNRLAAGENAVDPEIFYEIKVIRQLENQNTFSTVWENINYPTHFVDYSLPNNTKATYWVHPISTENIRYEPIQIKDVYNYNHQWTLLVCDDVYENDILNKNKVEVKEIYYFDKNIQSGSVTNNAEISIVKNFTQFPKYQVSNSNYWSGSLTGLVGYIGEDLITYHQTVEMVNKLAKLSNDGKRKFLKDIEGNIWEIAISAPVSIQNTDNLGIQLKTKTLSWTQIGDAKNIMIYSQAPIGKEGTDYAY